MPARGLALALLVLGLAVEAVYPFSFDPPRWRANQVARTPEGGLRFGDYNVARTPGPPAFLSALEHGANVRIALEIRAARSDQRGPARIFSVSHDYWNAALVVVQEGVDLKVEVDLPDRPAGPTLRVERVFAASGWHRVEVRFVEGQVEVSVDGRTRGAARLPEGPAPQAAKPMRLALGDEPIGNRPWRGEMRVATVAVDGHALDYLHDSALEIPTRAFFVPERLRKLDDYLVRDDPAVAGLHLLSFVPLGVLVALGARRRRELRAALLAAATLAIALQLAKVAFDARHPCLLDVAAQATGAGVGVWIVAAWRGR